MTDSPTLMGARVLVVGASAGIGRSFVARAVEMGALVCASARSRDKLDQLCIEAPGARAVVGDITVPDDCARIVAEAVELLGGLDLVLCTAGFGTLAPVADAPAEVWRRTYDVNVVGPMLLCAAALPVLAPHGLVSFMSSEAAGQTRWGLGAYSASKAALDAAIGFWRHEHPDRRFQRIVMGATFPTDFGNEFDGSLLDVAMARWAATGMSPAMMDTDDVAQHLAEVIAVLLAHADIDVPDLRVGPRGRPWRDLS